jgi:hypothetical protein
VSTARYELIPYIKHITFRILKVNVTQQDTQNEVPDDDVHTSKHAGAVECTNKLSE